MAFGVEANPTLRDKLFVFFVHLSVMIKLKRGKLSELLLRNSSAQTTLSENEVSYFVSLYEEASVFSPWSGIEKCLFKSISLKRFLRSKGIESTLVIGIKTAPFYAHAWLQIGMTVINDDIDYVGDYSPIFAD
ncbi:Transglutaminase-like superfamily protein [compost metagenome]